MTNLFSDLWQDLRDKRLWPVALVLLAALVAVPVVLSKSSEETPPAAPATSEARDTPEPRELKGLAEVKLAEASVGTGSSLDTFDPSNPFRPPEKVMKGPEQADAGSGSAAGPGTASSGDSVPSGTGGATEAGGGAPSGGGPVDTGGGDTGGDTGGGDTGGDDTGGGETTTTRYRYVVDVSFRANERTRKIKAMERLDMLPNAESPLLLFLGVAADGGDAVFLVDSTLEAAGEGRCQPSGRECAFLHIGPGSEHEFTDDQGDSYTLRVDEIRRVKVGAAGKASASRNKKPAAKAAVGKATASRRFVLPVLADFVSVSRDGGINSNSDSDRR